MRTGPHVLNISLTINIAVIDVLRLSKRGRVKEKKRGMEIKDEGERLRNSKSETHTRTDLDSAHLVATIIQIQRSMHA